MFKNSLGDAVGPESIARYLGKEVKACNIDFPSKLPDDVVLTTNSYLPYTPPDPFGGCYPKRGIKDELDMQKAIEEFMKKKEFVTIQAPPLSDKEKIAYVRAILEIALDTEDDQGMRLHKLINKALEVLK